MNTNHNSQKNTSPRQKCPHFQSSISTTNRIVQSLNVSIGIIVRFNRTTIIVVRFNRTTIHVEALQTCPAGSTRTARIFRGRKRRTGARLFSLKITFLASSRPRGTPEEPNFHAFRNLVGGPRKIPTERRRLLDRRKRQDRSCLACLRANLLSLTSLNSLNLETKKKLR